MYFVWALEVDLVLYSGEFLGEFVFHGRGDVDRYGRDDVAVAVQQLAGVDHDAADVDRHVQLHHLAVAVGADGAVGEAGEVQGFDLVEVAAGPAGDQAGGAEGLVGGTHDLAKGGGGDRVVEVLEDDDG